LDIRFFQEAISRSQLVQLPKEITNLVVVAYCCNHYTLLHFILGSKTIIVYDGFQCEFTAWKTSIMYVLQKWKLVHLGSDPRQVLDCQSTTNFNSPPKNMLHQMNKWKMWHEESITQKDNSSCGPIACYNGWKLLVGGNTNIDVTLCPLYSFLFLQAV